MRVSNRIVRRVTTGLAAAAISAAGLFGSAAAQTDITVAVPNPSAITWAPMWAAIGEGYFEEEGLNIDVQAVDGSSQVLQAMSAGQAQIGAPGPGPVLGARARGIDVVFIYNLYPKSVFGLLVKSDSGYATPTDLKGKVIGVGTADGAEVSFARAILNDAGMEEGTDFTFLPVGDGGTAAVAFLRGDVDAYAGAVSDAAILANRGLELTEITPEEYLAYFGNGYAVLADYMAENPEVVEGFGRALVKGMRFISDPANEETALDHMAAGNPQEGEDRAFASALLAAASERMTPTDAYIDKGFGYQPPEHWETWQKSLLSSGDLEAPFDDLAAGYTNEMIEGWNAE
ncbi:PhnD/SsuA/transferrin family substrate-binding protein [Rhodobacteraceae bacterium 2CG4]|uniref:PhnD/SsuA/transferrin family substrate-binding protein n=1 Tax=Halovulum marinum TaxID=2662447 RepID=A0A6L5Z3Y1_9RHOB|nr:ABC transporter substrate-binding protein [Halovulum marinum]MSU90800.1 PhnD/SsuA/transferrin family substrate-binding protein [Halovulum marinum]